MIFSASTSTHAHQHTSASSSAHTQAHALQLIPKSPEELAEAEASDGSRIAFMIPNEILKGPPREIIHQGRNIFVYVVRDIKLVNNEQHKMKIWHPDGDECPVKIYDFRGISGKMCFFYNFLHFF